MKFLEAVASGKKFRNKTWSNDQYLFVKDNNIYRSVDGYNTSLVRDKDLSRIGYDDWEIVPDQLYISDIKDGKCIIYNGCIYTKVTIKSIDNYIIGHGILFLDNHVRILPENTLVEYNK